MGNKKRGFRISYRILSILLALIMGFSGMIPVVSSDEATTVEASTKLTINTALNMAFANSDELEDLDLQYEEKQAELSSAVKSINIKYKQITSFSWSPLLKFHWPEEPDEATYYEFLYKPMNIQSEIDVLNHSISDKEIEITQEIYQYFVDIYTLDEKISYNTTRLETSKKTLERNKARLALGLASQNDVDKMQSKVEELTNTISDDTVNLTEAKRKLGKAIGIDVSTGYTFQKPYVDAEIPRDELSDLIQYTLDNDQSYYEVSATAATSLASLKTHYNLFSKHYKSGDMNIIKSYVTSAMNGNSINKKAFKKAYASFIKKIDSYWNGVYHVWWWIFIPKKWLKDEETDGSGWIDEDPQALYTAALDYAEKNKAKENAADALTENVRDYYNNYVSAKKAYETAIKAADKAKDDYTRASALNKTGVLSYSEFTSYADAYDEAEQAKLEALADYTDMLYSFDRLTCGRVMTYLNGTGLDLGSADGGKSYVDSEIEEGDAYYYIEPIIQNNEFELHVYIPSDYPVSVTHFELWVGNIQVGTRTAISDCLRHLKLDISGNETVKIRLYNGSTFVDDCVINGNLYSGTLNITKSRTVVEPTAVLGTYSTEINSTTGMVSLTVTPDDSVGASGFKIKDTNGKYLETEEVTSVKGTFTYLPLLYTSIDKVIVELCDADGNVLKEGTFDSSTGQIYEYNGSD